MVLIRGIEPRLQGSDPCGRANNLDERWRRRRVLPPVSEGCNLAAALAIDVMRESRHGGSCTLDFPGIGRVSSLLDHAPGESDSDGNRTRIDRSTIGRPRR